VTKQILHLRGLRRPLESKPDTGSRIQSGIRKAPEGEEGTREKRVPPLFRDAKLTVLSRTGGYEDDYYSAT